MAEAGERNKPAAPRCHVNCGCSAANHNQFSSTDHSSGEIPAPVQSRRTPNSRKFIGSDGWGTANVSAAEFALWCRRLADGGNARRRPNAKHPPNSGFFRRLEASRLSLVRAAGIGPRPDHQPVPLGGAAALRRRPVRRCASRQRAASATTTSWLGIIRTRSCSPGRPRWSNASAKCRLPALPIGNPSNQCWPFRYAVHLQEFNDAAAAAAGQDHDAVQRRS